MVEPRGLLHQESAKLFHQGAAQEISDHGVVTKLNRGGGPVVLLNRIQIAEAVGEVEPGARAPQDGDFAGWGGRDLWGDFGRCALPEHDIVQRAFSWDGEYLSWQGLLRPLRPLGAGWWCRCWALRRGAKEAEIDNGDCCRFVNQSGPQRGDGLHA